MPEIEVDTGGGPAGISERKYSEALAILDEAMIFGINPSLDGICALMAQMGEPHTRYPSIQVAGTNGKTSTVRMIAALLGARGLKTGLYTSPHLVEHPERIEIAGEVISHAAFAEAVLRAKEASDALADMTITEFELTTAAALWAFAREGVDVAVLECGMGGRWDSTSVVDPKVAVVTGIGLDHLGILGDTIEDIAAEKAAIIGPGYTAVLGPGTQGTLGVFMDRAAEVGVAPWLVRESDRASELAEAPGSIGGEISGIVPYIAGYDPESGEIGVSVECPAATYRDIGMSAPLYQAQNISTALAAAELFIGEPMDERSVRDVFATFTVPGRFETLSHDPMLIIDAAHNPQSALNVATAIARRFPEGGFQLLLAVLEDKDADGIVEALMGLTPDVAVTQTTSPRALPVKDLAERVEAAAGVRPEVFPSPEDALAELVSRQMPIVATGSITLAGEVKGVWLRDYAKGRSAL